jgi:hypothetical protein
LAVLAAMPCPAQFVESLIDFGAPVDSPIALPDFGGMPGALFITGRTPQGHKRIALYGIQADGAVAEEPLSAVGVGQDVLFYDRGRIGAAETVALLSPTSVLSLDPRSGQLRDLLPVQSIYRSPSRTAITELQFLRDVNQDGLDDVVLPDFEGVRIYLQQPSGFSPGMLIKVAPRLRLSASSPEYVADELYYYDFDLDGSRDLAVLRDNRFLVFIWTGEGFRGDPDELTLRMPLASSQDVEMLEENVADLDQSDFQLSQIFRVTDLNGDELPDVVTFTTISSGVFDKRTEYRVYLGRAGPRGVEFSSESDAMIPSDGFQVELVEIDANGNGRQDLVSTSLRLGLGKILKALFSKSMNLDVELRRMDSLGGYPARPDYRSKVQVRFSLNTGFVHYPAVRFGDFDGDGMIDLLLQDGEQRLAIHPGVADGSDFGPTASVVNTVLPRNGDLIQVVDADDDPRQDLLIGYGPGDEAPLPNQLRVLISR